MIESLPQSLRQEARFLRRSGASFAEISKKLSVSSSTARRWTVDIVLSLEQEASLRIARAQARLAGTRTMATGCRNRRSEWQEEGRQRARESDALHLAGCMLYWAEGSKLRNCLEIANSDPNMLSLFLRFLTQEFPDEAAAATLRLNLYTGNGLSVEDVEKFWLDRLELPSSSLRKHTLNNRPAPTSGVKKNKLPYGVATLMICRTRVVQHVWGAIQEYGEFAEPAWLDL